MIRIKSPGRTIQRAGGKAYNIKTSNGVGIY